jgi:hypothetical protein
MKHVHAELMMLYAQDAMETDKPWERWEWNGNGKRWIPFLEARPTWDEAYQYRRKGGTIKVNGFDVPEPMRDPRNGVSYWLADTTDTSFVARFEFQDNSAWRCICRDRGLIHSTKEAAAKHAMAMCGIDPATYKDES